MRKNLATVVGSAAVATLAAITVSGCGGSSTGAATPNVSMGAAGVDQLRTIFQQAQDSKQTLTEISTSGSGADASSETCKIQLHPAFASDCTTPGQPGEGQLRSVVLAGAVYTYQQDPDLQVGGKPWHKEVTPPDAAPSTKTPSLVDEVIFSKGAGTVTAINADTVNGKPCTRYDIALDFDKLVQDAVSTDANGGGGADPLAQLTSGGTASGQIWIGSDGLPAQTAITTNFKGQPTATRTYQFTDWNTPLTIQAPPADQVSADPPN